MQCPDVETRMMRYLDGRLGPEQARRLDAHLEVCPRCRRSYAEEVELVAVFHAEAGRQPEADLVQSVMGELGLQTEPQRRAAREVVGVRPLGLAVLGAALLALVVSAWQWSAASDSDEAASSIAQAVASLGAGAEAWTRSLVAGAGDALDALGQGLGAMLGGVGARWDEVTQGQGMPIALLTAVVGIACMTLLGRWRRKLGQEWQL